MSQRPCVPVVPERVLEEFGVRGPVRALPGGQGTSVLAGGLVLKPEADAVEMRWLAAAVERLVPTGFRLPAPVRGRGGAVVVDGWSAFPLVPGQPVPDDDRSVGTWLQVLAAGRAWHDALAAEARPGFLPGRDHRWAVADRVAWGERQAAPDPRFSSLVDRLLRLLVDEGLRPQLVHGDLSGNVLLAPGLEPAVIDVSPYWRPAEYAAAVVVVDALLWWQADGELVGAARPRLPDHWRWRSLLARATLFRLFAYAMSEDASSKVQDEVAGYERVTSLLDDRTGRGGKAVQ